MVRPKKMAQEHYCKLNVLDSAGFMRVCENSELHDIGAGDRVITEPLVTARDQPRCLRTQFPLN
jgi:hypothetical protein